MVESKGKMIPILTNHDGLFWDVRKDDVPEALDTMERCVVQLPTLLEEVLGITDLNIPFLFEVKQGDNLGNLKENGCVYST